MCVCVCLCVRVFVCMCFVYFNEKQQHNSDQLRSSSNRTPPPFKDVDDDISDDLTYSDVFGSSSTNTMLANSQTSVILSTPSNFSMGDWMKVLGDEVLGKMKETERV